MVFLAVAGRQYTVSILTILVLFLSSKCFAVDPANKEEQGDEDRKCESIDVSDLKNLRQAMPYSKARQIILSAGWQGVNIRWQDIPEYGQDHDVYFANGWHEVNSCAGTGESPCRFEFHDIFGNILVVITKGECIDGEKCDPSVSDWYIDSKSQNNKPNGRF